jgi:hypothetical protein
MAATTFGGNQEGDLVASRSRPSAAERRQHNRWAALQWSLLALLAVIGTIALFVLVDGSGITR